MTTREFPREFFRQMAEYFIAEGLQDPTTKEASAEVARLTAQVEALQAEVKRLTLSLRTFGWDPHLDK